MIMVDLTKLNDEELRTVIGGVSVNGIVYKYSINTLLKCEGTEETIVAKILNYAVIDGCPAYEVEGTKSFKYYSGTETLTGTLKESFFDSNNYYPMA